VAGPSTGPASVLLASNLQIECSVLKRSGVIFWKVLILLAFFVPAFDVQADCAAISAIVGTSGPYPDPRRPREFRRPAPAQPKAAPQDPLGDVPGQLHLFRRGPDGDRAEIRVDPVALKRSFEALGLNPAEGVPTLAGVRSAAARLRDEISKDRADLEDPRIHFQQRTEDRRELDRREREIEDALIVLERALNRQP